MTDTEADPARPGRKAKEIPSAVRAEVLRLAPSYGTREIARRIGCSRKLVRRILAETRPAAPPDATPDPGRATATRSLLDPYRERIRGLVGDGLTASRILRELRGEEPGKGYQGGKTILVDLVRQLRAELAPTSRKKVRRRFETKPGVEAQVDWSPDRKSTRLNSSHRT